MRSIHLLLAAWFLISPFYAVANPGSLAQAARFDVGQYELIVGGKIGNAEKTLNCLPEKIQHTIRQCHLKKEALSRALFMDAPIEKMNLSLHFQGDIVNMSIEYGADTSFDSLLETYKEKIYPNPKVDYWTDGDHLYASYIWIDSTTEIELSRMIKGTSDSAPIRAYVSDLTGNRPLNPEDNP